MPNWFYPLMLVVILAGYVFLFLQGREVRRGTRVLYDLVEKRHRELEAALRELSARPTPSAADQGPVVARLSSLDARIADLGSAIDGLAEGLDAGAHDQAERAEPIPIPVEDVARRFLLDEGFTEIEITGSAMRDEGIRLQVQALRGEQLRSGWVLVADGEVLDASLTVPTSFFP